MCTQIRVQSNTRVLTRWRGMPQNIHSMLSAAAVARRLDLPYPRVAALMKAGVIAPDGIGPKNTKLFDESRMDSMRKAVQAAGLGGARIVS